MVKSGGKGARIWPESIDNLVALGVLAFVVSISLFAIRDNDLWWHMAVGRELVESRQWLTRDPFLFSIPGLPWVSHAWLVEILFYAIHAAFSVTGLIVLRALAVTVIFVLSFRHVRSLGVSLTLASPVVLLVMLNAHTRFDLRPHLFEYVLLVTLLGWLIRHREQLSGRYYVVPAVLQVIWVNTHSSFYLGPAMVFLFYAGEWLNGRLTALRSGVPHAVAWKRVAVVLALMTAGSFLNPSPLEMVLQPLHAERREILTRYTLEWLSPFDPAIREGAFHPYYEYLLAVAALAFLLAGRRLRLSSLLLVGFLGALSLEAHRFRVEFSLVALPLVLDQLRVVPLVDKIKTALARRGSRAARLPYAASVVIAVLLVYTARDRITIEGGVSGRFPDEALRFVEEAGVAKRSFHTVGFGSYLVWAAYPERQTFIDGRMLSVSLYEDFLACQTTTDGFNGAIRKYDLDSFILPVPEQSDGGITRLHRFLIDSQGWLLAHIDPVALVYVRAGVAPEARLAERAYRLYHPMTFARLSALPEPVEAVATELERAMSEAPGYPRVYMDGARFYGAIGQGGRAREMINRALELDPNNPEALSIRDLLDSAGM